MHVRLALLLLVGCAAHADTPVEAPAVPAAPAAPPAPTPTTPAPAAPAAPTPTTPAPAAPAAPTPATPAPAAPAVPAQYECTSFPVRSTTVMGPFQAPADVSGAKVNATKLPAGWSPVGGNIGEGGAYVLACKPVGG